MKKLYIFLILILIINKINSQEIIKVKGSCKIRIESSISLDATKKQVLECAKKNAIEGAFGSKIITNEIAETKNITQNQDIQSKSTYNSISNTEVSGEWIETIGEPVYKRITGENGDEFIECIVEGKARALKKISVNFEAFPIAKVSDLKTKTISFNNNQDLYFYFKSAKDGFINIYLNDNINVYQLLPYKTSSFINYPVKADIDYFFFQSQTKDGMKEAVDELSVSTNEQVEQNTIIVLFSIQPFDKPILINDNSNLSKSDKDNGFEMPKYLSVSKFIEFQQKLLKVNDLVEKLEIPITIHNN
jgi:hypothetical protein